jgi:hypothetical protein
MNRTNRNILIIIFLTWILVSGVFLWIFTAHRPRLASGSHETIVLKLQKTTDINKIRDVAISDDVYIRSLHDIIDSMLNMAQAFMIMLLVGGVIGITILARSRITEQSNANPSLE